MIYAVFEDGSRQYMVDEGDLVRLDQRDAKAGDTLEFDRVLMFQTGEESHVGAPTVEGAKVVGEVVDHPSIKTYIQKFRRRKNYRRFRGHRQHFTRVRILELILPGWERPIVEEPEEDELISQEGRDEPEDEEYDEDVDDIEDDNEDEEEDDEKEEKESK